MNPTLPFDIIALILLMLPVESLARFQCVCRTWKNLIRDPIFIRKHLQNRDSKGNRYVLYVSLDRTIDRSFSLLRDETYELALEIKLPFELLDITFIVIGSSNGLLCLTDANRFGTTIYLCNPVIRKYKTINFPIYVWPWKRSDVGFALGIGYYDVTNDYRIVRIASPIDEDSVPSFQYNAMKNRIGVYSMISNSWKSLEVDYFPWGMFELKSDTFLNKSIHWKAVYRTRKRDISVIVAFHMGEEVFNQIDLPDYEVDGKDLMENIGVFKGDLAFFYFGVLDQYRPWHGRCHLWVMKEYGVASSWTKLYSLSLGIGVVSPIIFTKDDDVIFEDNHHRLCVCHPDSKAVKVIGAGDQAYLNCVSYIDSLVMLDG